MIAARVRVRLERDDDEIRTLGGTVVAVQADVSDRHQADEMADQATRDLGRIDVLVNNVGAGWGSTPVAPLPNPPDTQHPGYANPEDHTIGMTDELWHCTLNTNMSSAFYCCRAVAPAMLARRSGKIMNIASTSALMAYPYDAAYESAKAGLKMMTKVMAAEWGRYNVNVNVIAPGWFKTELTRTLFEDPKYSDQIKELLAWLPMRRLTDTRDLGLLALYLACPASDWMTGQMIALDGGETAIMA